MIALLEARRAGLLSRSHWLRSVVASVVERVTGKLEKAGLIDLLGRENFCRDLPHALSVLAR